MQRLQKKNAMLWQINLQNNYAVKIALYVALRYQSHSIRDNTIRFTNYSNSWNDKIHRSFVCRDINRNNITCTIQSIANKVSLALSDAKKK